MVKAIEVQSSERPLHPRESNCWSRFWPQRFAQSQLQDVEGSSPPKIIMPGAQDTCTSLPILACEFGALTVHLCRLVTGGAAAESLLGCWAHRTFVRNAVRFSSLQVSEIILTMPSSDQWHATKVFGPASDWCRRCYPVSCLEMMFLIGESHGRMGSDLMKHTLDKSSLKC